MTDIARLAGVSQSTVSLVINHMSGAKVSKTTPDTVPVGCIQSQSLPVSSSNALRSREIMASSSSRACLAIDTNFSRSL